MDAHSDFNESVATSPPTSLAPQSDDEFTTALVRHAAKRLGFEVDDPLYLPSSPQQHARGGGGGPLAVLSHRRLPEILRQLDIRQKALGPNHESLVDLHMQAAKHFEQAGELSKSEHHFTAALDVLETCVGKSSETLLPVLTSLAHFYASRGRFFDAQTMFARAAAVCEACHTGRMAAENPVQSTQPQRLRNALLQWKDRKSTDAVAVELRAGAAAVQAASRRGNVVDADAQTVEEPPQPHVPTLDSSSWQRLQSPSLTTADDMRRLLTVVRQEQPQYQYSSISVQHRTSPSRSSASVAAARSAADVRRLLDELRKAKNA